MSLLATVNARGTLAARPAAAAANEGYLYFATDGAGALYRSNGTTWETYSPGGLADQGTATYLDFTTAAAPANPAAGKIRVYSKTGDTFAQRTSGGTETVFGAGGGGLTQAYVGYNTVGASFEAMTAKKVYAKKVTLANACLLTGIEAYVENDAAGAGDDVNAISAAIYDDVTGTPNNLIGYVMHDTASHLLDDTSGAGGAGVKRWLNLPIGKWLTAGDYWIAVGAFVNATGVLRIAFDGSGTDRHYTSGGNWFADWGWYTPTTTTNQYSIRANTIR